MNRKARKISMRPIAMIAMIAMTISAIPISSAAQKPSKPGGFFCSY